MSVNKHTSRTGGNLSTGNFWTSRAFVVFLAFAVMGVALLWSEHQAHILSGLFYLFILACPLYIRWPWLAPRPWPPSARGQTD